MMICLCFRSLGSLLVLLLPLFLVQIECLPPGVPPGGGGAGLLPGQGGGGLLLLLIPPGVQGEVDDGADSEGAGTCPMSRYIMCIGT